MLSQVQVVYYSGPPGDTSVRPAAVDALLARLPPARRQRLERSAPAQRALEMASLRLLELTMLACGHESFRLLDVDYPIVDGLPQKPRWLRGKARFSLSHTLGMSACVVATGDVGVDVEQRRPLDSSVVARIAGKDLRPPLSDSNALWHWTRIEAVVKAAGLGILHGQEIQWDETALLSGRRWWLHEMDCGASHVMHVAVDRSDVKVSACRLDTLA